MEFLFNIPTIFDKVYTCYSMGFYKNCTKTMENGGKILLPSSALELLTRLHIQYPMLFKLTNQNNDRYTHCGVLEFSADEGTIFAPYWMMMNLNLNEGSQIKVENVALPIATYAKFQPLTVEFHNITNPKAVLENALRDFACLTKGDLLAINYNNKSYELKICETKPKEAVSIIECDMQVEFDEPLINKREDVETNKTVAINSDEEDDYRVVIGDSRNFKIFGGNGVRLDGKTKEVHILMETPVLPQFERGKPNYDYKPGLLTFCRSKPINNQGDVQPSEMIPFSGEGKSLKEHKTKK